jgi:transposase
MVASGLTCFVGIDLHKHFVVVAAVDAQQQPVLKPTGRIDLDDWPAWAAAHLGPQDAVVVEATGNAWWCYDIVAPLVGWAVVANPLQVKWIAAAAVKKTDRHDAVKLAKLLAANLILPDRCYVLAPLHVKLAKLLAANLIPEVWVPPAPVRELRALLAHRHALVKQQTAAKNRLHSLLHRHHLTPPAGDPFAAQQRAWWADLDVSPSERLRAQQDVATLAQLEEQLTAVERELARLSQSAPWQDAAPFLIQLPGFALVSAMTVLAAIGDIRRFPTARHLVGYAGLGAGVHDSGTSHHEGPLTKQGRRDVRRVLIEAAWSAVATHPHWKQEFGRLCRRKPEGVAIVAIARKLLVAVWHVLAERAADRHADPVMVATKLMRWSWELTPEQRGGLTTRQFVRYGLLRLGLDHNLTGFRYGGQPRGLASEAEILCPKQKRTMYPQGQLNLKESNTTDNNATVSARKGMTRPVDFMWFGARDVFEVDGHVRERHDRVIAAVIEKNALQP